MFKNAALLIFSVIFSLLLGITGIYLFAPELIHGPNALKLVRASQEVPPFFDNIFREEDLQAEFLIDDPILKRAKPFLPDFDAVGPHDLLGFRNESIPHIADVITIGDSMTYGNNANVSENWPSALQLKLSGDVKLYNMAIGGWGAIEYLEAFDKALFFQPRVIVVAMYTGNDPIDSFQMTYTNDRWERFRVNPTLSMKDMPNIPYPAPKSQWWEVSFQDGVHTIFTPELRLSNNDNHPVAIAGWEIMKQVASEMMRKADENNIKVIFTLIPTKELVFAPKVEQEGLANHKAYQTLVKNEFNNIKDFAEYIKTSNGHYIDTVKPLQEKALEKGNLYLSNENGHPINMGYTQIGQALAQAVQSQIPDKPEGLIAIHVKDDQFQLFYANHNKLWQVQSKESIEKHGLSLDNVKPVQLRDIAYMKHQGVLQ